MKILLSEECEILRRGISDILLAEGHDVFDARSTKEFFKECASDYDLIIMDLDWLGVTGLDLAKHIHAASSEYRKPIKILATYLNGYRYLLSYLFDATLRKPFTKKELLKIITKEENNVKRFHNQTNGQYLGNNHVNGMV